VVLRDRQLPWPPFPDRPGRKGLWNEHDPFLQNPMLCNHFFGVSEQVEDPDLGVDLPDLFGSLPGKGRFSASSADL
jgi:hypothetical protein